MRLCIVIALGSRLLWAQAPLSLAEATQRAVDQNRVLKQTGAAAQAKVEDARAARTRRWPSLTTSGQAGETLNRPYVTFSQGAFGNYPATGPIPSGDMQVGIPRKLGGYALSQFSLPLSGQPRLKTLVSVAQKDADAARQETESVRLNVIAQVRSLYFQIVSLEAARKAAASQVETAEETARLAREEVSKGTALEADQAAAEAKLAQAEADAGGIETDIRNGREQINLLLGEPLETQFVLTEAVPPAAALSEEEARRHAIEIRPQVKEARIRLEQAALSVRAKRLEAIPDVNLAVTHVAFFNSTNFLPNQFALAGLSLSWEPWDWGRKRHEAAGLRDREEQARLALAQAEQQVALEAGQAWREFARAGRNLAASRLAVRGAEENLRVVRERHNKQAALLRDVLEAETAWEAAGQQQARAAAAAGIAWANLESAIGDAE